MEVMEVQMNYFKSLKIMLLKCCTQYSSRKIQQWPQDWKDPFWFQFQRRAMPKNVQTTTQLCSFHMVAMLFLKSFKTGFSNMWTKNFQMYKPGFKEAEEPEIKLTTFVGSWRKQGSSRKNIYSCFIDYAKAFDCVDHNKLWKINSCP